MMHTQQPDTNHMYDMLRVLGELELGSRECSAGRLKLWEWEVQRHYVLYMYYVLTDGDVSVQLLMCVHFYPLKIMYSSFLV